MHCLPLQTEVRSVLFPASTRSFPIVLQLDDVLAAVDAHVAAWLLRHALLGPLLRGKTVLVLTHSPALLAAAALVVRLGPGGKVGWAWWWLTVGLEGQGGALR